MPADYILPTGQNQGQNPSVYSGVGPGFVPAPQTYASPNAYLRMDGNWAIPTTYTAQSTATQTPIATTRTYIAGTGLTIAAGQLQVGTRLFWKFNMTKTGAGSATSTFDIAFGTTGTVSDTAIVSFTKPVGTAVIDEGWVEIDAVVKAAGTSTGVVIGEFRMVHNLAATGHATIPIVALNTTSSTFNSTTVTNVGVCITSGTSDAITIDIARGEASNLAVLSAAS